jgi:succinate dehydrogenase / fumarate reductase, cytochrome b subunit
LLKYLFKIAVQLFLQVKLDKSEQLNAWDMSKFIFGSIGRKFLMSVTGIFLLLFILVHLTVNLLMIFDDSGTLYNLGAHFMVSNPVIKVVEPILGLGFLIHIIWSMIITWENWRARPVRYRKSTRSEATSWASRNMFILGGLVFVFLGIHLFNFYIRLRFTGSPLLEDTIIGGTEMHNTYAFVSALFKESLIYSLLYVLGGCLLGLHVTHGFWSAFQTIGISNKHWLNRLQWIARVYAILVAIGFSVIPLYFIIRF